MMLNPASSPRHKLNYRILPGKYAICKFAADAAVPAWSQQSAGLMSITRTAEELSIVCAEAVIPPEIKAATGWTCFQLQGPFPFTQTGVLTSFIEPLSSNSIPIFVVSTFDTDYVLTPEEFSQAAVRLLGESGHVLLER